MTLKTILTFFLLFSAVLIYAQGPTANFTTATSSGCSPLVVDFQDQSTGNPTAWFWDFGNGATSTLRNPSTTYFNEGVYSVKLTVTNAAGSNTLTRTNLITIYGKPSPAFKVSDSTGCYPLRAQFTDLSGASTGTANTSWFWDFGDGSQSTQQNPLHAFTSSGSFAVTLKVTNDKGCFSTLTKPAYIRTSNGVRSSFSNMQAAVCKPPFAINFTATSTGDGNLSYLWNFGDGATSTLANPSHTYTSTGNYTVILATTSSIGCSDTVTKAGLINTQNINTAFSVPANICVNDTVQFQNTSSPKPIASVWNFGDGTTSSDTMPVKVYSVASTYKVTLYNTYSYCKDSFSKTVTVTPKPVINFTADKTFNCQAPFAVNFQDQSANAVSWQWDFGDSTTSTLQNPAHVYANYGYYNVQLIVTNAAGCSDTLRKDSLIKIVKPVITIPALPAKGCVPYTINPVATIKTLDNVTSYLWDFGDGGTSSSVTPSHTYTNQGTYTVKLTITTSSGCTETLTLTDAVKVGTKPVVDFSATPSPICALQAVQFTNLANVSDEWSWDFGDGTGSGLENPTHAYSDTGFFSVTFTAINNGCAVSVTKNNIVKVKPPVAKFNVAANCSNKLQFNFSDNSIGAKTWLWDFGDGTTSTLQSPVHSFPAYKTYTVTLTVTNNECSNSIAKAIKVFNENPDFRANDSVVCKPSTVSFTATSNDITNLAKFSWDLGSGTYADTTASTVSKNYMVSGNYSINLIATDVYGCTYSVKKPNYLRVNGPIAKFSASNTNGCIGLTTTFNDVSQTDGQNKLVRWQWNFGDSTIQTDTAAPFQHVYKDTGTFSVKLQVTDAAGCTDTVTLSNIVTTTNPMAKFLVDTLTCPGSTLRFTNTTSNATNYTSLWSFGDGATSTAASPTHAYADTGRYTIQLKITDTNGCTDSLIKPRYINVDRPVASFTVSDSVSSCAPFQVQFTNTSHFTNSFIWNLAGGTSTLANPVQYYVTPGSYQIQLSVTSPGGCRDTARKTIVLYDTAGSKITYLPLNGCKPLLVDLATYSPGPVTYTWDFGDGVIVNSDTSKLNHVYKSFGDFVPKVIFTDPSGCVIPITGADTIRIIGATGKFGLDKKLFCDSGLVNILDSTTFNDPITSYNWSFGDGATSNQPNPGSHYYTAPGIYTVSLNLQTQSGCVDTFTLKDILKVVQSPLISISGDSVICVNDSMRHLGVFNRADTSAVQWQWQLPNGNSSALQNPAPQQYTTAGNFIVTAIATNSSGCKDSATKNILINPLPVITMPSTITKVAGVLLTIPATYTSNVISYNWVPASTLSCTDCAQPETHTKFNTKYSVAVVDSNGCRNTGQIQVIVVCPGTNVFVPNTFSPNGDGNNDVFYVRGRGLERVKTLRIFNRWGEVVFEQMNFPVNNALYGWDGKYKGNKPVPDVYVYQLEVFCENSEIVRFEGNVALIQ